MHALPSLRLTTQLNAVLRFHTAPAEAAQAVRGGDVAHHVVDPEGVLGLDPLRATPLADALPALAAAEPEMWLLCLPAPGRPGSLRGPLALNTAALDAGEAVLPASGGPALVPQVLGSAVQWRVFRAERPFPAPSAYDADRALSETVLAAGATLARLDVAAGRRPADAVATLPAGYSPRQQSTADRAARLLQVCDVALASDGAALSLHEAEARARELRRLRAAAADALCAAASWMNR